MVFAIVAANCVLADACVEPVIVGAVVVGNVGSVGSATGAPPPPPSAADGIVVPLAGEPLSDEFICCIALAPAATAPATPNAPLTVLIATQGIPNVNGEDATALAFAIPVLTTIFPIAAACSNTTPAIAIFLFLPANCCNKEPNPATISHSAFAISALDCFSDNAIAILCLEAS